MWLINFLPDWIFHGLLTLSILALLVSFVPLVPYKPIIQVVSIIILGYSIYAAGAIAQEAKYKEKEAELQKQILELQLASKDKTAEIVTKYVDKIKIVKEKGNDTIKEIPYYITKTDNDKCVINNGFVMLHDKAARLSISTSLANEGTTTSKDNIKDSNTR